MQIALHFLRDYVLGYGDFDNYSRALLIDLLGTLRTYRHKARRWCDVSTGEVSLDEFLAAASAGSRADISKLMARADVPSTTNERSQRPSFKRLYVCAVGEVTEEVARQILNTFADKPTYIGAIRMQWDDPMQFGPYSLGLRPRFSIRSQSRAAVMNAIDGDEIDILDVEILRKVGFQQIREMAYFSLNPSIRQDVGPIEIQAADLDW